LVAVRRKETGVWRDWQVYFAIFFHAAGDGDGVAAMMAVIAQHLA
jgi:hypothetical protein